MKVLVLGDGQGWIVDRIVDKMISLMPFEFTRKNYTTIPTPQLVKLANSSDLTYYSNWDFSYHLGSEGEIKKPVLMSIRSHRYPEYVKNLPFYKHVITPELKKEFPDAAYIPDGIFDYFLPKPFIVGMAFHPQSIEHKGYYLVKEACDSLGIELKVAWGIAPEKMREFYESIDLYVCASLNEGHSTPVMECLMMNKPVLTTSVGIPSTLNVHKCERSVESIRQGIERFYTYPQVKEYGWDSICSQFTNLFKEII